MGKETINTTMDFLEKKRSSVSVEWGQPLSLCLLKPMPLLAFLNTLSDNADGWKAKIESGEVRLFRRFVTSRYTLKSKDLLSIDIADRNREPVVDDGYKIVYEDHYLLIINKGAPLPVHPCGTHRRNTLTSLLARDGHRVYTVNRIDSETSGLVYFVKQPKYGQAMAESLRQATKTYLVLIHGYFPQYKKCTMLLGNKVGSLVHKRMGKNSNGKYSETYFRRLSYCVNGNVSLCAAFPSTGRTHQIRAHVRETKIEIAAIKKDTLVDGNYSVVGDKIYGKDESFFIDYLKNGSSPRLQKLTDGLSRQFLHAARCRFYHPFLKKVLVVRAKLPSDLEAYLASKKQC